MGKLKIIRQDSQLWLWNDPIENSRQKLLWSWAQKDEFNVFDMVK